MNPHGIHYVADKLFKVLRVQILLDDLLMSGKLSNQTTNKQVFLSRVVLDCGQAP